MLFLALLASCTRVGAPQVTARLRIGLGASALALSPDGRTLAVACKRSNDVWILDMAKGVGLDRVDTGARPRALLFHREKPDFYVAEGLSPNASVALINLADQRVARRFKPQGLVSRWLALPGLDRILTARLGEPLLGVYRLKDWHLVKSIPVGGEVTALAKDEDAWWAATRQADSLARLSPRDLSLQAVALAGPEPRGLALDTRLGRAYVACQGRVGEAAPLMLPSPEPTSEVLSPLSDSAGTEEDEDAALSPSAEGDDGDDEEAGLSTTASVDRFAGGGIAVFSLQDTRRLDYIEVPGGPTHVELSPDGQHLALACADGQLRVFDLGERKVGQILRLGGVPGAMMASPDRQELWIALSDAKQLLRVKPGVGW
jgi:DNA-binding beta-propeller fold protein YncE